MPKICRVDVGTRFNYLVLLEDLGMQDVGRRKPVRLWRLLCDCGNEVIKEPGHIKAEVVVSCGCFRRINKLKHGHNKKKQVTSTYGSWFHLKQRCQNPNNNRYHRYGGRGIKVCDRWLIFKNFLEDMGEKPGKGYTIDRIDINGNYEPDNCEWVTIAENNRRRWRSSG